MKVFVKRAYESIVRDYHVYIDEDLAAEITKDLERWCTNYKTVTVEMIEQVFEQDDAVDLWDIKLLNKEGLECEKLSDFIYEWLQEAAWEDCDPEIIDGEVHDTDWFIENTNY